MIDYPDANRLMAGELGDWLAEQVDVRADAVARSNDRLFKAGMVLLPLAAFLFILVPVDLDIKVWLTAIAGGLAWAWSQQPKREAKKQVKTGINQSIADSLGMTYEHDCDGSDAFETCRGYRLFPSHDRSSFEDLWVGEAGGRRFMLHEVHLEELRGSGKHRRWVSVFRGAIIEIGFDDRFHGTTLLVRDGKFSGIFGGAKDSVKFDGEVLDRTQMVSPEFEDEFDVYTTDRTEANYLVHPEYIERLVAIERALSGSNMTAMLKGGSLIIAIATGDMFESGSLDHKDDEANLERTIGQFARLHDMALTLNGVRPDRAA